MVSTTFTIRILPYLNSSDSVDGLTFIFAPDNRLSPPYSYDSYLGVADKAAGGNVSQLAVELDAYKNGFDIAKSHWHRS
ncbi:Lectin receptor kinase [Melia azedarach]|uniref:Lectin receptor kinase n=1 Tax=Melia azedarach TaxID=155640 RepID=A0ACC1X976_MELAZ|nr:Lectin receptor kinase [Melia azedarach]